MAAPALAQTASVKTFDLEQVTLSPGGQHSLLLSTGDILAKGGLRLSLAAQYQRNPLVLVRNDLRQGAVIRRRLSSHLGIAYGLTERVELALQLPVILSQAGDDLSSQGIEPLAGTVLGAPVLQGRWVLMRQASSAPADLGLNLALALPFGSSSGFARAPGAGLAFSTSAGFGRDFGSWVRLGAEVGAVIRKRERLSTFASTPVDQVGSYATLGVTATTLNEGLRGEVSARALITLTKTLNAGEVLAGARYSLPHGLEVFALAGPGLGQMPGNPVFRAFVGVASSPFRTERPKEPALGAQAPAAFLPPVPLPEAEQEKPVEAPPPALVPSAPIEVESPKLAELKAGRIELQEQIHFATGKAEILSSSFPLLEQVAKVLDEHPELARLRISGHTDDRGPYGYNVQLSQERAESVRRFLVERGVEPSRLEAKGYGPDQPIDTNATPEGRQKNRRTEFVLINE